MQRESIPKTVASLPYIKPLGFNIQFKLIIFFKYLYYYINILLLLFFNI